MKYSIHVRCPHGAGCPDLWRKDGTWRSSHGSAGFACRLPTSAGVKANARMTAVLEPESSIESV